MRIGVLLPQVAAQKSSVRRVAELCENAGIDGVFGFDQRSFFTPTGVALDVYPLFPTLEAAADATSVITLGSCVARVDRIDNESVARGEFGSPKLVQHFETLRLSAGDRVFAGLGFGDRQTRREDLAAGLTSFSFLTRLRALEAGAGALSAKGFDVWLASKSEEVQQIAQRTSAGILLWDPPKEEVEKRRGQKFAYAAVFENSHDEFVERLRWLQENGAHWAICGMRGGVEKSELISWLTQFRSDS